MDVFRIFDAMNDVRNFEKAVKAAVDVGAHAQGTISYTTSPVHNLDTWTDLAKRLEDLGCHSICIKDMAGLISPEAAFDLVTRLKEEIDIPIQLHSHYTSGMAAMAYLKGAERESLPEIPEHHEVHP